MARYPEALVKPELLVWAREDSGLEIEEVARKIGTSTGRVQDWETGDRRPTIRQLRELARVYRRPLAVFYLPEPPREFQALRDHRRLPGGQAREESYELRLAVREAHYLRDVALELYRELEQEVPQLGLEARAEEDPEEVGRRIRQYLEIEREEQASWTAPYEALNAWRSRLEGVGILVYQATGVQLGEVRGFSIAEFPLPLVAVNVKDAPRGRIFSLLHELAHVALRMGGLCDFHVEDSPRNADTEVFCNHVAGAALVPAGWLLEDPVVLEHSTSPEWRDEELGMLSRRFSVSREVVLRRLLTLGRTTLEFYRKRRAEYLERYRQRTEGVGGGPTWDRRAVARVGALFARLALESYYRERITASDLSEYLGVKLKHMAAIEKTVYGRQVAFGVAS